MKKTYINPLMKVVVLNTASNILAGSGGVTTTSTVGKSYDSSAPTYGRGGIFDESEE